MESLPPLPALRSIISANTLVSLVEAAYALKVTRIQLIKAIVLDTYRLWTNEGPYILRVYPSRGRTRSDLEAELAFLAYLKAQGLSVSVAMKGVNGEHLLTLQAPEGGRYAALFTYAPGEPLGEKLVAIHRYGYTLARLHTLADAWPSPSSRPPLDLVYLLDRPLEQLANFPERRHDWAFLHEVAKVIRPQLAALPTSAPHYGYCHGDAGTANAHVTAEGQLTLFDFDFCGPGWRVYDLATFSSGESVEVVEAFLAGYEEVRPLTAEELKALPMFQIAQSIWLLGLRASYINEWGELYFANWFIDRVMAGIKNTALSI